MSGDHGVGQRVDGERANAVDRRRPRRDDRPAVPEPRRLGEAPRRLGDLADLAAEAELAEHDEESGAIGVSCSYGADHGHRHCEVAAGLGEPGATDGRHVHVVAGDREAGAPLDDGEQHRQPPSVEAAGVAPPGRTLRHRHGERLDLDEQRPLSRHRRDDDRSGDTMPAVGEEQVRRVGHADQTAICHLEQSRAHWSARSDA